MGVCLKRKDYRICLKELDVRYGKGIRRVRQRLEKGDLWGEDTRS